MSLPLVLDFAQPLPPLDLDRHLPNYLLVRSFQKNWSLGALVHVPVSRPALRDIAAGDHYFEWRIPGNPHPVISVLFACCPAYDSPNPIYTAHQSPRFKGLSVLVFYHTVPHFLGSYLLNRILDVEVALGTNLTLFTKYLEDFVREFHRDPSPSLSPNAPLTPLEN